MKPTDWSEYTLSINIPDDDEAITIPIHGEKETDINKIMKNAYYNAV